MKKTILLFTVISVLISANIYNQNVPNGGFENWTTVDLFDDPNDWNTGNTMLLMEGESLDMLTASKTEDSYSGDFALELISLVTDPPNEDTLFGYAICAGNIGGEGDTLIFKGGFPVSGNPDSLCGYFKYSIVPDDTAYILCAFKKDGIILLEEYFQITGEQSSFAINCFDVHADTLPVTIDSVVIAFACSDFNNPKPGSTLIIDSLWLAGISDTIPNHDFENWTFLSYEDPDEWTTTNSYYMIFVNDEVCATKSTDSYSGTYALKLENNFIEAAGMILSLATTSEDIFSFDPTVPMDFNPSSLQGYYKYSSTEPDTAMVAVFVYGYDELIEEEYWQFYGAQLEGAADYTFFEIPMGYPPGVVISSAGIMIVPGSNAFMGDTNIPGGVLFIDDLVFIDPCEGQYTDLIPYIDTTICEGDAVILDAGGGYIDYYWTTGETTQTVSVNSPGVYKVFVFTGSCILSDSVVVNVEICSSDRNMLNSNKSPKVYPNPGNGIYTIELPAHESEKISMHILDILGHEVYTDIIETKENIVSFDISNLEPGIYYLNIETGKSQYLYKILMK